MWTKITTLADSEVMIVKVLECHKNVEWHNVKVAFEFHQI